MSRSNRRAVPNIPFAPNVLNKPDALSNRKKGRPEFVEIPPDPDAHDRWLKALHQAARNGDTIESHCYREFRYGECGVILTRQYGRLHVSVSTPTRLPTWDELSQIWYNHLAKSGQVGIIVLPKPENFVNIHKFCMQILEVDPGEMPSVS